MSARDWRALVVVLRPGEPGYATDRGSFAGELLAADLRPAARECTTRTVPPGCVLVWLEIDAQQVAGAGFVVVDLRHALRDVSKNHPPA